MPGGLRGGQGAPSLLLLFFQSSTQLAWHGLGGGGKPMLPPQHLAAHYPGRGPAAGRRGQRACARFLWAHEPGRLACGRLVVQRVWNWWKTPLFPRAPHSPPNPTGVSQGNNIMLVASQPALQGSERKSYEIVFREVRGTGHPVSDSPTPPPLLWSLALKPATLLLTPPSSPQSPPPVPGRQELGGGLLQKQHTEPNPLHPHVLSSPHPGILAPA